MIDLSPTWEEHAATCVIDIASTADRMNPSHFSEIANTMDGIIDDYYGNEDAMIDQSIWMILGGSSFNNTLGYSFTVPQITDILIKKQKDYGPLNIWRFGLKGIIVRVHDKVARLENLLSKQSEACNESIEDTLIDIIGYSAIAIMLMRDQFLTPLASASS